MKLIDQRLCALADDTYQDADARRLAKRLDHHRDGIFTFPEHPHVPRENNFAERQIRPAVILRKNSQSNRSECGAATQAVLMSVFRPPRLRGLDPINTSPTPCENCSAPVPCPCSPISLSHMGEVLPFF